jgi:hypothetical protein
VETAREMVRVIARENLNGWTGRGQFTVILSDTSPSFEEIARRFLGRDVPAVELVSR